MSRLADLERIIAVEAAACVEVKKKNSPLGGFFDPRKKFIPGCELEARNKYAAQLADAQAQEYEQDDALDMAFINKVTGNDNSRLYGILGVALVFMLIIVIVML